MNAQGWTLIELVLTMLLISILGSFVWKIGYDGSVFTHYQFSQSLIHAVNQAKSQSIYHNLEVELDLIDNQIVFIPMINGQSHPNQQWQLDVPKGFRVDEQKFPVRLGKHSKQATIAFQGPKETIILDARTIYAYRLH